MRVEWCASRHADTGQVLDDILPSVVSRMRPTGRADQCPELGVERTQRGRRCVPCDGLESRTRFTHRSASVLIRHHAEGGLPECKQRHGDHDQSADEILP